MGLPAPRRHRCAAPSSGGRAGCRLLPSSSGPGRRTRHAPAPGPLPSWPWHPVRQHGPGRAGARRVICRHRVVPRHGDDVLAAPGRCRAGGDGGAVMDYNIVFEQVRALLQREKRLAYRVLKRRLQLDDDLLEDLKDDLLYAKKLAVDEEGKVLVWAGGTRAPSAPVPTPPEPVPLQSQPPHAPEGGAPSVARHEPAAKRRQLTVLFCDLVDSTALASQLDPEELRDVILAYQATCAAVIQRFDGHIAQYLGDGLLVYFGYPRAHEDDAQRAVQSGLGMVEAITSLNARLAREQGVQLAVRLGIHTGLVVVGAISGGGRQEHLALGETPNVAARLQALAAPNTVVISATTHRLVQM